MSAIAPERLERGRLVYERITREHAVGLEALLLDPHVYATLHAGDQPPTAADARQHVDAKHAHWKCYGFGLWLRDRATGTCAHQRSMGSPKRVVFGRRDRCYAPHHQVTPL